MEGPAALWRVHLPLDFKNMRANTKRLSQKDEFCLAGKTGEVQAVDIAATKALASVHPVLETENIDLLTANDRVIAKSVKAGINIPPFDNSAMDGFAVSKNCFTGSGPWKIPISGRLAAGDAASGMEVKRSAIQIMTGAPVPPGTDTIIMQEHCALCGDHIEISNYPVIGRHIRRAGEDVAAGTEIAHKGQIITPALMSLLAASGIDRFDVSRRVRVGLISTGSELVEPGNHLTESKIYNSNRYFLRARLDRAWVEVIDYGIIADSAERIRRAVKKAAESCHILITTGGVSAGEEDHLLDVLKRENATLEVLKVAMRPGKPVTVGRVGNSMYFGLPGNPYAAAITFLQIAWPAIQATGGINPMEDNSRLGLSNFGLEKRLGRTEFIPVTWYEQDSFGRPIVEKLGRGSSASLHPLAQARAIAVLPPERDKIVVGDSLRLETFST